MYLYICVCCTNQSAIDFPTSVFWLVDDPTVCFHDYGFPTKLFYGFPTKPTMLNANLKSKFNKSFIIQFMSNHTLIHQICRYLGNIRLELSFAVKPQALTQRFRMVFFLDSVCDHQWAHRNKTLRLGTLISSVIKCSYVYCFIVDLINMSRHCTQCNLTVPVGTVVNPFCFGSTTPHSFVDDAPALTQQGKC
jgi:hypothetical protein